MLMTQVQTGTGTYVLEEGDEIPPGPRIVSLAGRQGFARHSRVYGFASAGSTATAERTSTSSQTIVQSRGVERLQLRQPENLVAAAAPVPPDDPGGSYTMTEALDDDSNKDDDEGLKVNEESSSPHPTAPSAVHPTTGTTSWWQNTKRQRKEKKKEKLKQKAERNLAAAAGAPGPPADPGASSAAGGVGQGDDDGGSKRQRRLARRAARRSEAARDKDGDGASRQSSSNIDPTLATNPEHQPSVDNPAPQRSPPTTATNKPGRNSEQKRVGMRRANSKVKKLLKKLVCNGKD